LNKSSAWNTSYLPEIDGLRAFSIIFVIAYHAFPDLLKSGYVGVDIFFVISGFLITNYIIKNLEKGQFSPIEFFGRRIRRLFPTLIVVMASSIIFGWFVLLDGEYKQLGNHIASSSAFVINFILASESGYFDNLAETKPMLHLWSLAVEEQFYIVWPIVLCMAWKYQFNILKIFIIFFIISFYLHIQFIDSYPAEVFFWSLTRFWELASGGILAWVMAQKIQEPTGRSSDGLYVANIMSFLGFSSIIFCAMSSNLKLLLPLPSPILAVAGASLIIASGSKAWLNRIFLINPVIISVGLISYPLYLWHWPILSFLQIIEGGNLPIQTRILALIVSFLLAWLTYKFIELPVRSSHKKNLTSIILIIGLILVGSMGWIIKSNGETPYNVELKKISDARNDWLYPGDLLERNGAFYTSESAASIMFMGDSHMSQYSQRVVDFYQQGRSKEAVFLTGGGCTFIPNLVEKNDKKCSEKSKLLKEVLSRNPIKTIVIGLCFNCYFAKKDNPFIYHKNDQKQLPLSDDVGLNAAKNSFYDFVKKLSLNYKVVILQDNPVDDRFDPAYTIGTSTRGKRSIPMNTDVITRPFSQDPEQSDLEEDLILNLSNHAEHINQSEKICPNAVCNALDDNLIPIYKDGNHMTSSFVKNNMDVLDEFFVITRRLNESVEL
jgi:peptidoglycan/LPS O-acetylase OafA/YrhL